MRARREKPILLRPLLSSLLPPTKAALYCVCIVHSVVNCSLLAVRKNRTRKNKKERKNRPNHIFCGHHVRRGNETPQCLRIAPSQGYPATARQTAEVIHPVVLTHHVVSMNDADSMASTSISGRPCESAPAEGARSPASRQIKKKKTNPLFLAVDTCTKKKQGLLTSR